MAKIAASLKSNVYYKFLAQFKAKSKDVLDLFLLRRFMGVGYDPDNMGNFY